MASLVFDSNELDEVIERAVTVAIRRLESNRPKDAEGRVLLTKHEASEVLGASEATVDRWRKEFGLPCLKLNNGGVWFRPESLREWAANKEASLQNGG